MYSIYEFDELLAAKMISNSAVPASPCSPDASFVAESLYSPTGTDGGCGLDTGFTSQSRFNFDNLDQQQPPRRRRLRQADLPLDPRSRDCLRKERRKASNRKAAAKCRDKKRAAQEEKEKEISILSEKYNYLEERCGRLEKENEQLKAVIKCHQLECKVPFTGAGLHAYTYGTPRVQPPSYTMTHTSLSNVPCLVPQGFPAAPFHQHLPPTCMAILTDDSLTNPFVKIEPEDPMMPAVTSTDPQDPMMPAVTSTDPQDPLMPAVITNDPFAEFAELGLLNYDPNVVALLNSQEIRDAFQESEI